MASNNNLKKSYQKLLNWYKYRAEENSKSLLKLQKLLSELDRESQGNEVYDKDIDDLESLKFIYETGIRNFESQVDKYQKMIKDL
ncbi:hypothetical protein [Dyadobacter psychrophilus]|uniref:Uncharacterized protein n=1 Tax=Dyadobacter psychrophilus TaxID=651661 RepID=A0A1T5E4C6_9BACT|nr:hypothetical protein [Dyadobacter psychrophilus]SKB78745.1 hypothetical protein SAMN05660293_02148 [Dyadobacter psychrophilus]